MVELNSRIWKLNDCQRNKDSKYKDIHGYSNGVAVGLNFIK